MGEDMRFAHAVEFLTGDDAGCERVGTGIRGLAAGSETEAEEENGNGFHGVEDGMWLVFLKLLLFQEARFIHTA